MKDGIKRHNIVYSLLYPGNLDHVPAIQYGRQHEVEAVEALNMLLAEDSKEVKPSGLFVDKETGYLAASPDGVMDDTTIVEIKCPLKCRDRKIEDLTKADSSFCLEFSTASGLRLKRQHNFY